ASARFPILLIVSAIVFLLGALYVVTKSPVYRAETTIIVEPQISGLMSSENASRGRAETEMMMRNQVEILQSRPVLQRVAENLNLVAEGGDMDDMINRLEARTRVRFQEGSGVINIIARSGDPALSAAIANELAAGYITVQSEYRDRVDQNSTRDLSERVAELAEEVRVAEEALTTFRVENDLTDVAGEQSLTGLELADVSRELVNARAELSDATAKVNQARQLRQSGASLDSLSEVLSSPLISQLRQRQTDLNREAAQLRERLGPNHPDVIEMQAEQRELNRSINQQVGRFIQQLQNDADVAASRVSALEDQLAGVQGTFDGQSEKRIQLRQLEREAQTAQEIYLASLSRLGQSTDSRSGLAPDARVLSAAIVPTEPNSTPKPLLLIFMIPVALIAGYGAALGVELATSSGFRSDMSVTQSIGVPVLGHVPALNSLSKKRLEAHRFLTEQVIDKPRSPHSAAVRDIAALLKPPAAVNRGGIIIFASTVNEEGAGPMALAAARSLAHDGRKVALIDADIFSPTLPELVGMSYEGPSLGDYLTGDVPVASMAMKDHASTLHLFANAGDPLIDAPTAAEGLAALAEKLAGQYDLVLIKSAPLLTGSRAVALYNVADQILLTVRWEMTPREAVESALHQLGDARTKLAGAIMYDVDRRRHEVYSHGLLTRGISIPRSGFRQGA
ncbi:MAG: exopolysaccharide transport family protein, partial [Pseudomonadota bacterium]